MKPESLSVDLESLSVTPELLAQHSITPEEYQRIVAALGRPPGLTELGIYSVMWSEHCSYKSSRVHLKRLPTRSERVVQGPGENAGIIDVGDGWACAFKIESHNHPSFIEPFQGAATGVGGILRDIFTMGARPLAVMDSLRFGPICEEELGKDRSASAVVHKNHSLLEGVVSGIAAYGNCFGVPNLGGETRFERLLFGQSPGQRLCFRPGEAGRDLLCQGIRHRQSGDLRGCENGARRYPRRHHGQRGIQRRRGAEAAQRAGGRSLHGEAAA